MQTRWHPAGDRALVQPLHVIIPQSSLLPGTANKGAFSRKGRRRAEGADAVAPGPHPARLPAARPPPVHQAGVQTPSHKPRQQAPRRGPEKEDSREGRLLVQLSQGRSTAPHATSPPPLPTRGVSCKASFSLSSLARYALGLCQSPQVERGRQRDGTLVLVLFPKGKHRSLHRMLHWGFTSWLGY